MSILSGKHSVDRQEYKKNQNSLETNLRLENQMYFERADP